MMIRLSDIGCEKSRAQSEYNFGAESSWPGSRSPFDADCDALGCYVDQSVCATSESVLYTLTSFQHTTCVVISY